jgi:lon-related putative ATP-dependent protease
MFFKRGREGKTTTGGEAAPSRPSTSAVNAGAGAGGVPGPLTAASRSEPLAARELRRAIDPASLGFGTTAELEPISGLIGQERALRAIEFGAGMKTNDFNIFVLGPPASGKTTAVRAFLAGKATQLPAPSDWVYVYNFENANRPRALRLPVGRARLLEKGMVAAIDELRVTLPAAFEGEDSQARRRSIDQEFRASQEEQFEALSRKAQGQNIAILRTPTGFGMAPMHEGRVVKPEIFASLPDDMKKGVETKIEALQKELEKILESVPKSEKQRRGRMSELNEEIANAAVVEALDDIKAAFADVPEATAHLDATHKDLVRNVGLFLASTEEESQLVKQPVDTSRDPRFRRYMVNVVVGNGAERAHAPIVEEINPTYPNLIGRVDHIAQMGALMTDFLLIKPGALHRANGGYLLLDARKLLLSPFAYEALKRAMKAQEIKIEQPAEATAFLSTQSLDPEPIPLDVKVVLTGDRELYYLLSQHDPDFLGLFKVQADFDDTIPRSTENYRDYARVMASILNTHQLRPLDAGGAARVLEEGARLASDQEKLSIEIGRISDILREADYWAGKAGHAAIQRDDITRAIDEQIQRSDRLRDRAQESIGRDIVFIDTDGDKVGQINALSVLQLGSFAFGRPSRITARVRMGQGRVTDIEREVNLGGPLHSKGVMILWGFLAGRFAQDVPLALAASLVFEQSYGGVDGDSASSTELYALLSALSEVPIHQGWAVTGSVNQWGEVQPIGGANEKIEGFYDVCKARGLTGRQGVLIPRANVQHLMLREDVVEAVRRGEFAIHAVATIDEGIEILTGIKAGERTADGSFEPGTINRLVEDKLRAFAERARAFGRRGGDDDAGSDKGSANAKTS